MCLDGVACAAGRADRAAGQNVVREDQIGRKELPDGGGVAFDVALPFLGRELLEEARLLAFVAVEHEDRQRAFERRLHGAGAAEVVLLGVRLLRDHDDVMAGVAPFARERPRVDVRPGPAEQIPVPEQNPQVRQPPVTVTVTVTVTGTSTVPLSGAGTALPAG